MIIVYIDPFCSGLQTLPCKKLEDVEKTLVDAGMDEDSCSGEVVYYVFIGKDGSKVADDLNYT